MKILGEELEYDFLDADLLEKYEKENQKLVDTIQEPEQYEGLSTADSMRLQCKIVDEFFDALFGKGTADKLFGGKAHIGHHMEAFGQMAESAKQSGQDLAQIEEKYTKNRAERRKDHKQKFKNYNHHHNNGNKK